MNSGSLVIYVWFVEVEFSYEFYPVGNNQKSSEQPAAGKVTLLILRESLSEKMNT